MTALGIAPGGTRQTTKNLHERVERYLTPNQRADYRGAVVMHEVPHETLPRRADILAINFYTGRPAMVGVEIKATRADWLTELRTQEKAEAFAQWCNEWWIAAPEGLIDPGEIPPGSGWGLMTPYRRTTMRAVLTPTPRQVTTVPQGLLVAAAKKIDSARAEEVLRATDAARLAAQRAELRVAEASRDNGNTERQAALMRELLAAAGIPGSRYLYSRGAGSPEGRALLAGVGGLARVLALKDEATAELAMVRENLDRVGARLGRVLDQLGGG